MTPIKKYLFSTLTFITGFFVIVLIHVFFRIGIGGLFFNLCLVLNLMFTIKVYRKFREKDGPIGNDYSLSKTDLSLFQSAFENLNYSNFNISELRVGYTNDRYKKYFVAVRTKNNLPPDIKLLCDYLYKIFEQRVSFDFINLDAVPDDKKAMVESGNRLSG